MPVNGKGLANRPESSSHLPVMSDPYSVLGVAKTALGRRHPQGVPQARQEAPSRPQSRRQGGRGQVSRKSRRPNDILSDPEKRRRFDAGEIDATGQEMPPRGFYRDQAGGFRRRQVRARPAPTKSFVDMGGIFSEMFGQRGGRNGGFLVPRRARAEASTMGGPAGHLQACALPFLVAARGGKQRVNLPDGKTLDIDNPRGRRRRSDPAASRGRACPAPQGRPPGRRLCRDPCRPAPPSSRRARQTTSMSRCR